MFSLIWIFGIEFEMIEFSWEFVIESDMVFGIEFELIVFSMKFGKEFDMGFWY